MKTVFALALCVVACSAHMCLLEPKQRGSISGLNNPGSNDCILTTGPCGGRPMEEPMTAFRSGSNATVIFQKNLDHFNSGSPGFFSLTMMNAGGFSKTLFTTPDSATKSLTLYTATVSLMGVPKDSYVLQGTRIGTKPWLSSKLEQIGWKFWLLWQQIAPIDFVWRKRHQRIFSSPEPKAHKAQYVTKNPQAPAVFYQCADVAVV